MKITATLPASLFFAPSAARQGQWSNLRPSVKATPALRLALENEGLASRRQEGVCSVILLLCLLSSLAVCVCQFLAF